MTNPVYENVSECLMSGDLTISSVTEIKNRLNEAISSYDNVIIAHQSDVVTDISYFQILFSAYKTALNLGKNFRIKYPLPPQMHEVMQESGFYTLPENITENK
ncbi:MAG: STAS domain-containing protein [Bacteroidota bacterium]